MHYEQDPLPSKLINLFKNIFVSDEAFKWMLIYKKHKSVYLSSVLKLAGVSPKREPYNFSISYVAKVLF